MNVAALLALLVNPGPNPPSYLEQLGINMRYHELKATEYERGSTERQYHEDRATQYRDELLGNTGRHK